MNLEYNLISKHTLKFGENEKFRILMMSDLQENLDYNPRTLRDMDRLIERVKPDFVMLGGDNCNGHTIKWANELTDYLNIFAVPMEKRGIPWAHIYGNHDHELAISSLEQSLIYESYPHCVSKHTEGIHGSSNFVLPVMSGDGSEVKFALWALDTNREVKHSDLKDRRDPHMDEFAIKPTNQQRWDFPRFDQQMWYWNSSVELEAHAGKPVNGMMFMHVAPWEFQYVVDNPELCGTVGSTDEIMRLGYFNSGIFSTVVERGDIRCIACAHSHEDDFQGTFAGITVCLDATAGYSPYGIDERRGGRVFEIDESDTSVINTYMIHYSDL